MNGRTVVIACGDAVLRQALIRGVGHSGRFRVNEGKQTEAPVGAVVVMAVADASPEECRSLCLAGAVPIVLVPLPSAWQKGLYEESGAVYLPMQPDAAALIQAIERAKGCPQLPRG